MKIQEMVYQKERKMEILFAGVYRKYKYFILNLGTHPTAYIEIPKGNKLYKKSYNKIYDMGYGIDVHGGLTYSDKELMGVESKNWFIGWDYAHYNDYLGYEIDMLTNVMPYGKKWTTEEIIEECQSAIDQIIEIQEDKKVETDKLEEENDEK